MKSLNGSDPKGMCFYPNASPKNGSRFRFGFSMVRFTNARSGMDGILSASAFMPTMFRTGSPYSPIADARIFKILTTCRLSVSLKRCKSGEGHFWPHSPTAETGGFNPQITCGFDSRWGYWTDFNVMNASFRNSASSTIGHRDKPTSVPSFSEGMCTAPDCRAKIPGDRLMCAAHWEQVPEPLQYRVINQLRLAQNGYPGAAETYRRACVKAVDCLAKPKKPAPAWTPDQILESAQMCALAVLELNEPLRCEAAWRGFYTVLQANKINPSRLGVLLKKWNDGDLREVETLRAAIEEFSL